MDETPSPATVAKIEAMNRQMMEADAAQPEDAPPTIASLNRDALPKAIRLMVDYCENAPWEEVQPEVEAQFPRFLEAAEIRLADDPEVPEDKREGQLHLAARSKLAGLVVGVALGVTLIPGAEPTFAALVQADRLNRMVKVERMKVARKARQKQRKLEEKRKARKRERRNRRRNR